MSETDLWLPKFQKEGPKQGPGGMAYEYHCLDCYYVLVTVAATDLLPDNRELLLDHLTQTGGGGW